VEGGWGGVGKQEGSCYSGQQVTGSAGGQVRGGGGRLDHVFQEFMGRCVKCTLRSKF
jgi:hypothetical protein